ncbi:MAG: SH3 domain-containing protein [Gemmatimonadales bacterium]
MRTAQFTKLFRVLPAWLVWVAVAFPCDLDAQGLFRTMRRENFRQRPDPQASLLATVEADVSVASGGTRGQWLQVDLEGWIWSLSIGRINSADFDLSVTARSGENLRNGPNGRVIARLRTGALLEEIERRGNWVHVRRTGWMFGQSLERVRAGAAGPGAAAASSSSDSVSLDRALLSSGSAVTDVPNGTERVANSADVPVRILARSGEWVRIQLEGWVRREDLQPFEAGVLLGVSSAEIRASPGEYEGRLLQWQLQYISLQVADELRRDLPTGSSFMLTRGPMPEAGFVYVIVPAQRLEEIEGLRPLTELVVIGQLVRGSSSQLGNPILELVDVAVVEQ